MIAELEAERDRLDEAILALERLSTANLAKRRGRPPHSSREDGSGQANPHDEPAAEAEAIKSILAKLLS